jgi:DNA helicase-2/ATP-dependent DNA helicase PcrA
VDASSETGYYGGGPGMTEAHSRWEDTPSFGSGYSSPGWRRAQARGATGGGSRTVIEGEGRLVAVSEPSAAGAYGVSDRVFHQKFGPGTVMVVEGNKLTVAFDHAGEKRVIDTFVEPG